MSGSVAEALLASGSKKLPLLPPPPKLKKDPTTFTFDMELAESNEKTYPEFSWIELVKNEKEKEITKRMQSGTPTLNPYASDDEEDLKAMAAKFEAKYNTTAGPVKKKKRRVEDYIDRGAGYDESDPFIDNSEVYDEVVPVDLQTAHGGFYINSGSLDFKEVELSEDEDDSLSQPPKVPTLLQVKKAKTKIGTGLGTKPKNPVGRPPGAGNKRPSHPLDKNGVPKKRKLIVPQIGPDGKFVKPKKLNLHPKPERIQDVVTLKSDNTTSKVGNMSSSSASSSSTSSGESSSSSDSDSSSSEETDEKREKNKLKVMGSVKIKPANTSTSVLTKPVNNIIRQPDSILFSSTGQIPTQAPPKRLKTKNVPLNPKLHPNLVSVTSITPVSVHNIGSLNTTPSQQISTKVLNKDLIKPNGGCINMSNRTQSPSSSGIMSTPTSSPSLKIAPPKPVSTPTVSPGVTVSTVVTSPVSKVFNNNMPSSKPKVKAKQTGNNSNNMPTPSQLDIFSTLTGYNTLNLNNFTPNLTSSSPLLKGGLNLIGAQHQKTMPNLKKMSQASPTADKLVQKQQKAAAAPKPVKSKPKHANAVGTPPSSHSNAFNSGGNTGSTYLSNLATYKTPPPPLAGPGVEISKVRTAVNTTPKTTTATSFSASSLGLATVSLALTPNSNISSSSLTSTSFLNSGITSILSSSPNSLVVGNVPSSLTVQRLPQSITITPSSTPYSAGGTVINNSKSLNSMDTTKANKHVTAFDVSSLLQHPSVSYTSSLLSMGSTNKSGAAKGTSNSIANNRDMQRK